MWYFQLPLGKVSVTNYFKQISLVLSKLDKINLQNSCFGFLWSNKFKINNLAKAWLKTDGPRHAAVKT